jgi:hypothetical protein
MDLTPYTAQEIRDCETPNGMRVRIRRYAFSSNALAHNLLMTAEMRGWSGEDTMTWLAFEALKRVEHLEDLMLEHARLSPMTPLIVEESAK